MEVGLDRVAEGVVVRIPKPLRALRCGSADAVALGIADGGHPVPCPRLGEDPVDVGLDRVAAQEQAFGDFGVGQVLGDQTEDLHPALGQAVRQGRCLSGRAPAASDAASVPDGRGSQQRRVHVRVEDGQAA